MTKRSNVVLWIVGTAMSAWALFVTGPMRADMVSVVVTVALSFWSVSVGCRLYDWLKKRRIMQTYPKAPSTMEAIHWAVERLTIGPKDVIVLRTTNRLSEEQARTLEKGIEDHLGRPVLIVRIGEFDSIGILSLKQAERVGLKPMEEKAE